MRARPLNPAARSPFPLPAPGSSSSLFGQSMSSVSGSSRACASPVAGIWTPVRRSRAPRRAWTVAAARPARLYAAHVANIHDPVFDEPREHPGFRALRSRIGRQAGSERIGMSLWEVPPGEAAYPYHYHLAEEELVIVLEGRPSLRTAGGLARARARRGRLVPARRGRRPPARQPQRRDGALPRDQPAGRAGRRHLPRLGQARRLRAPARAAAGCTRCSAWPTPSTTTTASDRRRRAAGGGAGRRARRR